MSTILSYNDFSFDGKALQESLALQKTCRIVQKEIDLSARKHDWAVSKVIKQFYSVDFHDLNYIKHKDKNDLDWKEVLLGRDLSRRKKTPGVVLLR